MLGCIAKVTSDIHHVAHTYANPIVVSVSSATGRAYTTLCQTEWCYSDILSVHTHRILALQSLLISWFCVLGLGINS